MQPAFSSPRILPFFLYGLILWYGLSLGAVTSENEPRELEKNALLHFMAGVVHLENKDNAGAVAELRQALRLEPGLDYLKLKLAKTLVRQKEYKESFQLLLPIADGIGPYSSEANVLLAGIHLDENKLINACSFFSQAINRDPRNRPLYHALAGAYLNAGMPSEAIVTYDRALEVFPEDGVFLRKSAELLFQNENFEASLDRYQRVRKASEPSPDIEVLKGIAWNYSGLERWSQARETLAEAQKLAPLDETLYRGLLNAQMELEDFAGAFQTCAEWAGMQPGNLEVHLKLAFFSIRSGKFEEGLALLRGSESRFPDSGEIQYWLARLHHHLKQYAPATDYYHKAFRLAANSMEPHYQYALLLRDQGSVDLAIRHLKALLTVHPGNPKVLNLLGYLYLEQGYPPEEARYLITLALSREPDNPAFLDSMGWALFLEAKYDEALTYLLKAAKAWPVEVVLEHLIAVYQALGRDEESRPWKEKLQALRRKD